MQIATWCTMKYRHTLKAQQDEISSNAINDTLEDDAMTFFTVLDNKTKAKFGDDKTFDDLNEPQQREVFASITRRY